jgi:predicted ArsR family transcriptional regulator
LESEVVPTRWDQRFFESTRGRIIVLLRRASRTVDELAQALDLTDNAVRAHLTALERDGLVQQHGVQRGRGKPAYAYDLTPEAERLFPKPYALVLRHLLDLLAARLGPEELEALLRNVGAILASGLNRPTGDIHARLEAAVTVLNGLGGLAELEERDGAFMIRGYRCPLATVVPGHPEICQLAATLLTEVAGVPLQAHCKHLQCCFEVPRT